MDLLHSATAGCGYTFSFGCHFELSCTDVQEKLLHYPSITDCVSGNGFS